MTPAQRKALPKVARALDRKASDEAKVNALLKVLNAHKLHNEDGEQIETFAAAGWDRKDFTSISKATLRAMLEDAYYAGKADGRTQMIDLSRAMQGSK